MGGGLYGSSYIFCLLLIKAEKVQEHDLYENQILSLHHLQIFFQGLIIKKIRNVGPRGPAPIFLGSEYSSSKYKHLFNTNMYLIYFYGKKN